MKVYGYARISTAKQSLQLQRDEIEKEYPTATIYEEVYTGTKMSRAVLDKMLTKVYADVDAGKPVTVVFYSVSRMSRNAAEGVKLYMELFNRGVNLVFLKDSYINTDIFREAIEKTIPATGNEIADIYIEATNKVLRLIAEKQIVRAFEEAEKEVNNLHQRTSDGMRASGATNIKDESGKIIAHGKISMARQGQKYHSEKEYNAKVQMLIMAKSFTGNNGDMTDREMIEHLSIAKNTFYTYKAELKQELETAPRTELTEKYKKLLREKRATKTE